MGVSPVELITGTKIEHGPLGFSSLPHKQAELQLLSSHSDGTLTRMPSQLEGAMDALITVFYNYSGNDGDKYKLNKGELKELLNSELTDFLTSQKDPMLVEKIMNDLDSNKDNEVDFNEFVVLVAALTVACNDFFQEQKKKNM
ncbi:Protein S100-Z S100 calcium-binding protein Z [Collichthys lucidus]|uniref:Protein S100 n=2 Tax=Collichthys lucidus TaxID=240159 RepID=A0A4U5VDE4_COLLU|nr:Protein S100-Z S100 calcium-binding protein Z [Collichthys lucidus]